MGKKVEDAIKTAVAKIVKKHNITDTDRLINLLTKIVIDKKGARFDKNQKEKNHQGFLFMPLLEQVFSFLSPDKAMSLLENTNLIELTVKTRILNYWLDKKTLFYTHEELLNLTKRFIKYLHDNRTSLVSIGYPAKSFESSYWFYHKLAYLYPVKISGTIQNKGSTHQVSTEIGEKTEKNGATRLMGDLTDEDIEQIQEQRAKLLNLKTKILKIACKAITNEIAGKKNGIDFYNECMNAISDKLSQQDFQFFYAIEEKYAKSSLAPECSDSSSMPAADSTTYIGKDMEAGGLKNIFEFIFIIEKELLIGKMHKIKTRIMPLIANQTLESYYQLVSSPRIAEIDGIIFESLGYDEKEVELHQIFRKKLENDIGKKLKIPLFVLPELYNPVEAYAQLIQTNRKIGIDVTSHFTTPFPQGKEIHPIKLPPNTRWEDITIQFIDGYVVKITAPNFHTIRVDYKDMGFENERKHLPNKQWELLRALADNRGELAWDHIRADRKAKKRKQLLSKSLKGYFQIEEDPFLPYKQAKAYKTRFELIPD